MDRNLKFKSGLALSFTLLILFVIFTLSLFMVDVQPLGYEGSSIGYATLNTAFHVAFPYDAQSYHLTELLGYLCIALAALNAVFAVCDCIRHGGIKHMHRRNIITMSFYAVVVLFYVLFEFLSVNLRPVAAEASYPSTHTLMGMCVLYSCYVLLGISRADGFFRSVLRVLCIILMIVIVAFRLLCGVHWLTDVIGGFLLSLSLMSFYGTFIRRFSAHR